MYVRALLGYAMLFMAIGILVSYFVSGFTEFLIVMLMLFVAYVLLCKCC